MPQRVLIRTEPWQVAVLGTCEGIFRNSVASLLRWDYNLRHFCKRGVNQFHFRKWHLISHSPSDPQMRSQPEIHHSTDEQDEFSGSSPRGFCFCVYDNGIRKFLLLLFHPLWILPVNKSGLYFAMSLTHRVSVGLSPEHPLTCFRRLPTQRGAYFDKSHFVCENCPFFSFSSSFCSSNVVVVII